jgi:hypothetical protein
VELPYGAWRSPADSSSSSPGDPAAPTTGGGWRSSPAARRRSGCCSPSPGGASPSSGGARPPPLLRLPPQRPPTPVAAPPTPLLLWINAAAGSTSGAAARARRAWRRVVGRPSPGPHPLALPRRARPLSSGSSASGPRRARPPVLVGLGRSASVSPSSASDILPSFSWRAPLELGAAISDRGDSAGMAAVAQELWLPSTGTTARVVWGSSTWWGRHRLALLRHHADNEGDKRVRLFPSAPLHGVILYFPPPGTG